MLKAVEAYKTTWGLRFLGVIWGKLLNKFTNLIKEHIDKFALAVLEALDVGMFDCFLVN